MALPDTKLTAPSPSVAEMEEKKLHCNILFINDRYQYHSN